VKTFGGAHVALLYYPKFDRRTEESIRAFRMKYDPFVDSWEPHIPFIFPVPCDIVDEGKFIKHVETVLKNSAPFSIRIGGFAKSWDHWLFLLLKEGNEEAIALHDELYTGILSPYLRRDIDYVPHTGIGLFVRKDIGYNVLDPKVVDFDAKLFSQALKEAESLKIDSLDTIDRLVVNKVILKTGPSLRMDRLLVSSKEIKL
jgi:2'-5' RNA ligase superfamily